MRIGPLILAVALIASPAFAGPFGLEPGGAAADLQIVQRLPDFTFKVNVPTPLPDFDAYYVLATPEDGICKITAVSPDFRSDGRGETVRDRYERIRSALLERYGPGEEVDLLAPGSAWADPATWALAVSQGDRKLMIGWGVNGSPPAAGIERIALRVGADALGTTHLELAYEFTNFADCQARVIAAKAGAL